MNKARWIWVILLLLALLPACQGRQIKPGQVVTPISYDFEADAPGWSVTPFLTIGANRVLGPFNDRNKRYSDGASLTVTGWPSGADMLVTFELYCIGTLDSGGDLADRVWVELGDGTMLLDIREFPNQFFDDKQEAATGNRGWIRIGERERAYWTIREQIRVPASRIVDGSVKLVFDGEVTGRKTEFWALDNVVLDIAR